MSTNLLFNFQGACACVCVSHTRHALALARSPNGHWQTTANLKNCQKCVFFIVLPTKLWIARKLADCPRYRKPLWGAVLTAMEFHASGGGRAHSSTHPSPYFPTTIILYKSITLYIFHTYPAYRPSYRNLSTITIHKSANQTLNLSTIKNKVIHNIKFSRHIININNDKFLAL